MTVNVRHATPDDRQALSEVDACRYPQQPVNPEHFDFAAHAYLLALTYDRPVGYLEVSFSQREGDPAGKVWAYLTLAHEAAAATHALYGRLEAFPGVRSIFTMTHESREASAAALLGLGYRERLRSYGADLEVTTVDLRAFGDPEVTLRHEGIHIHTLTDLREDPEHADKLYALYRQTNPDVPEVGHSDTLSRAAFGAHLLRDDVLPEAYHVALHGEHYVAYSELFRQSATKLAQETTAVLSSYRRRVIALALKLRGLEYAQKHGYTLINTGMASNNAAMVTLNMRLGFVPQAAYITFSKNVR